MTNIYLNLGQFGNIHKMLTGGIEELQEIIHSLSRPRDAKLAQNLQEVLDRFQTVAYNALIAYTREEKNFIGSDEPYTGEE